MTRPKILQAFQTALVVIDIQEGFRHSIPDFAIVASRASTAARGFQILGLPVIITEQYPKGLGMTAEEIRLVLPVGFQPIDKAGFSSCAASAFVSALEDMSIKQVVLCGLETHICKSNGARSA